MGASYLVTGATGYLGGRLCARLCRDGHEVHAVVRPTSNTRSLAQLDVRAHIHGGSTGELIAIVEKARPAVVFHLASNTVARHDADGVPGLISSNVAFGAQLLEAMHTTGVGSMINAGTAWQHFGGAAYSPVNLYAATKQAFLDVARFYHESYGIGVITLELPDIYGPGDPRRKLFGILREAQARGQGLDMTAGRQEIDLLYIDDAVEAFAVAARAVAGGLNGSFASYRVSSGSPRPLREVVELFAAISGAAIEVNWGGLAYRPREMMTPWSGGEPLPGWRAGVSLEEGLRRMLQAAPSEVAVRGRC